MKTHPIRRDNGSLRGFEITSTWISFWPMLKLLRKVPGVTDVQRQWFNDDRVTFKYHGKEAVVNEPWGDNSRYWVGLQDPDASPEIDISPLLHAFQQYRGFLIVTLWPGGAHND